MTTTAPSTTTDPSSPDTLIVTSPARRALPRRTGLGLGVVLGGAALVLAACGGGSSTAAKATSTTSTSATTSTPTTTTTPGTVGRVASITGQSMEVQSQTAGQTTVNYTSSTTFDQTIPGTLADVTAGACVSASGTPSAGSGTTSSTRPAAVTATAVRISQPVSGSCAGGFGIVRRRTGTTPSGSAVRRRSARRGTRRSFGAVGTVASVSGSTFVVTEANRRTGATSSVTVTVGASTTYTQVASASATDLAVGKCVRAIGPADTTGAITARSITISTAGASGCSAGLRGRRRLGTGAGGGAASA